LSRNSFYQSHLREFSTQPTVKLIKSHAIIIIIQHITAACEQLAPTEYVKRHDGLAKIIHQKLAEAAELIDDKCPYCKNTPANVLEDENFKLYWNRSILTDKTILLIDLT